jgi:hypothetical protein
MPGSGANHNFLTTLNAGESQDVLAKQVYGQRPGAPLYPSAVDIQNVLGFLPRAFPEALIGGYRMFVGDVPQYYRASGNKVWSRAAGILGLLATTMVEVGADGDVLLPGVTLLRYMYPQTDNLLRLGNGASIGFNGLDFTGAGAVLEGMLRNPAGNAAGNNRTGNAGGATTGATDKNGGTYIIQSGIATGNGGSGIAFQTVAPNQGAGTADRNPTTKLSISGAGIVDEYGDVPTVSNGLPSIIAQINSTGLTANVAAADLLAAGSVVEGFYRISAVLVCTTAASVSSTMPNAQIIFTDKDSNASVTLDVSPILGAAGLGQSGLLTANVVGTMFSGVVGFYAKVGVAIQYKTINYASTAAGMAYALRIRLEKL